MELALNHGSTVPNRYVNAGLLLLTKEVTIIDWIRANSQKVRHRTHSQIQSERVKPSTSLSREFESIYYAETQNQTVGKRSEPKLAVPRELVERTLDALQVHVQRRFCDLVFTLNGMSISDWDGRTSKCHPN
jgi:hypothetical protein